MFNKVFLIGRLTRDPEVRYTPSGIAVARFTLAINRAGKNSNEADFIRIVAWRRLAEICGEYLKKGRLVAVEGRLQIRAYQKDGMNRTMSEVVADNMQMLEKKNGSMEGQSYASSGAASAPQAAFSGGSEEAIPF